MYQIEYSSLGGNADDMFNAEGTLRVIRKGLPVNMVAKAAQILHIGKTEFAPLIGLSTRSLQRNKEKRLTPQQSEHTLALLSVKNEAAAYFGAQDTALTWLKTPQLIFGNQTPLSYLDTMTGIEYVHDVITRLKHGMTA